ncbi:MAG: DNA topoisomerase IB [Gemmatimonadota bacterium]|nr:DNA topoisomerase IB [Gemmatimonadota bacterium]
MSDDTGVWRREGSPEKGFRYLRVGGKPLKSKAALERIRALAIPPAWTDVRISPKTSAKVQATGYDAARRKQYIYHPRFVERQKQRKYRKLLPLARALPQLRAATNEHLKQKGLTRQRVLATVVRLISRAFFRVGSERYAVTNKTFGIATLRKSHLEIRGNDLIFHYKGKKSIDQRRVVAETPLVEILKELLELPGERLFRYLDEEGTVRDVTAADVNEYLKEILGERYTSKDIRTWGGTVRAATILADLGPAKSKREAEKNVVLTCKLVSTELGNTPTVCRSAYIHPAVLEKYLSGKTIEPVMRKTPRPVEAEAPVTYYPEEAALMRSLERWSK